MLTAPTHPGQQRVAEEEAATEAEMWQHLRSSQAEQLGRDCETLDRLTQWIDAAVQSRKGVIPQWYAL